ncbi:MAG TPA: RDD family protein [Candidatus Obscuribacterales bacterium]
MNTYGPSGQTGNYLKPIVEDKKCWQCGQIEKTSRKYCEACGNSYDPSMPSTSRLTAPNTVPTAASALRGIQMANMRALVSIDHVNYAGFWVRFGAYLIDSILLVIGIGAMVVILAFTAGLSHMNHGLASLMINGLALLGVWFYFAGMESSEYQATCGKIFFGLRVTDTEGRKISFWRATGRYLAKFLSSLPFNVGYLMIAFTEKKQGLHDSLAGTVVVKHN